MSKSEMKREIAQLREQNKDLRCKIQNLGKDSVTVEHEILRIEDEVDEFFTEAIDDVNGMMRK